MDPCIAGPHLFRCSLPLPSNRPVLIFSPVTSRKVTNVTPCGGYPHAKVLDHLYNVWQAVSREPGRYLLYWLHAYTRFSTYTSYCLLRNAKEGSLEDVHQPHLNLNLCLNSRRLNDNRLSRSNDSQANSALPFSPHRPRPSKVHSYPFSNLLPGCLSSLRALYSTTSSTVLSTLTERTNKERRGRRNKEK
ncbi:hypothetical protein VTK73DRAFT_144 [Phialemonium thermophilum]|uniref:Uncharacterized protein n=1 Tax=Phialemonium thermophilum TaxID=223376 RepID=A0ABR3XG89_9PEZI